MLRNRQKLTETTRKTIATVAASVLFLSSCSSVGSLNKELKTAQKGDLGHLDAHDPQLGLTRDDYKSIAAPKAVEIKKGQKITVGDADDIRAEKGVPPIPKLAEILATPRPPKIGESQLVSISVTDDVPLKDVLLELAKLTGVDMELDATITGGIEFIAKDKPFNEVIERITTLAGLRYTMKGNVLRVERDTPFVKNYTLDFLNQDRDSDSTVTLATNVLSTTVGGGGGGSAVTTGGTSSVKTKTSGDFWKALESSVVQVLSYVPSQRISATVQQAETDVGALAGAQGAPGAAVPPPKPVLAPVDGAAAGNASASNAKNNYTINRQAGILTVNATSKQHELMETMLNKLKENSAAQVILEAKIIEVNLNDEFSMGIDWSRVINGNTFSLAASSVSTSVAGGAPASFALKTEGGEILKAIELFGTTRTISSPRLHAINNQLSTMTFAKNVVYFTVDVTVTPASTANGVTTPATVGVKSTTNTVPIGVILSMMPSIDLKNNEVTLSVRPTLSTQVDTATDPGVTISIASAIAALGTSQVGSTDLTTIKNLIPVIQVRELDSSVKLKSGETMVIGGLMEQTAKNTDAGVPFLSGVPVVGNLFKNTQKQSTNKELVLVIKATIVNSSGDLNKTDKTILDKFSKDPRPVSF